MTLSEVFDRLRGHAVSRIDFKDGSWLRCPKPMLVDFDDVDAEGTLEADADGLVLHFNQQRMGSGDAGLEGTMEPLSNIAAIS